MSEPSIAELEEELERSGQSGLWRETAPCDLNDHGFVQNKKESFAETMARSLWIEEFERKIE